MPLPSAAARKVAPEATLVVPVDLTEMWPPSARPVPSATSLAVADTAMSLPVMAISPAALSYDAAESRPAMVASLPALTVIAPAGAARELGVCVPLCAAVPVDTRAEAATLTLRAAATETVPPVRPPALSVPPMLALLAATMLIDPFRTTIEPPSCIPLVLTVASNCARCIAVRLASAIEPATRTSCAVIRTRWAALMRPWITTEPSADSGTLPASICAARAWFTWPLASMSWSSVPPDGVITVRLPVLMTPPLPTTNP